MDKEEVLDALVKAHKNASKQFVTSEDMEWGYRAGVRDVAIRLGLYDDFLKRCDDGL